MSLFLTSHTKKFLINISFNYQRTDTCWYCDEKHVKPEFLRNDVKYASIHEGKVKTDEFLKTAETELNLHKLKTGKFYD